MSADTKPLEFVVDAGDAGRRLDQFVMERLTGYSRRTTARLFEQRRVSIDGYPGKKGMLLRAGQRVSVNVPEVDVMEPQPELPLELVLVRHDLVIVDKRPGVPSGAVRPGDRDTAAAALLGRFPEMRGVGFNEREPGLVHRLDTFTSGLLLAARDQATFSALRDALDNGQLVKRYLALVIDRDVPDTATVHAALGPHRSNRRKVSVLEGNAAYYGRPATTHLTVLERRSGFALLEIRVGAAYRHQIRAHLAYKGWPIVGDEIYGAEPCPELGPGRHALHACYMRCTGSRVLDFEVESRLPSDMAALLGADS
ncbi:MAG TPA: pseudouridine synthase [Polyangiaceae bacterium]